MNKLYFSVLMGTAFLYTSCTENPTSTNSNFQEDQQITTVEQYDTQSISDDYVPNEEPAQTILETEKVEEKELTPQQIQEGKEFSDWMNKTLDESVNEIQEKINNQPIGTKYSGPEE